MLLAEQRLALADLQILRDTKMSSTRRPVTLPTSNTALTGLVRSSHLHHLARRSASFKANSWFLLHPSRQEVQPSGSVSTVILTATQFFRQASMLQSIPTAPLPMIPGTSGTPSTPSPSTPRNSPSAQETPSSSPCKPQTPRMAP